jgi:hypothetical protein
VPRPTPPNALSLAERAALLDALCALVVAQSAMVSEILQQ